MRKLLAFSVVFMTLNFCMGQITPKSYFEKGLYFLEHGDFPGAVAPFKKAHQLDPENPEYAFMLAESYRLYHETRFANTYYEKTIELDAEGIYTEAYFHLGQGCIQLEEFDIAKTHFEHFIDKGDRRSRYYKWAKQGVDNADFAKQFRTDSINVTLEELNELNTSGGEYAPVAINAHQLMYVDSNYQSKRFNLTTQSSSLPAIENLPQGAQHIALNQDSTLICFSMKDLIYQGVLKQSKLASFEPLPEQVNTPNTKNTQPQWLKVGNKTYIVYSSDRPRGKGGMDIWLTERKARRGNVKWGNPKNLSRAINSPGDEICPWYNNEDQVLYFSSNFHAGFGGFDIFKAEGNNRSYRAPQNMGKPINSTSNDLYFSKNRPFDAYFASNRSSNESSCCNNLYHVVWPEPILPDTVAEDSNGLLTVVEKPPINSISSVTLYFDNDRPVPRSYDTTTQLSYYSTYTKYLQTKATYAKKSATKEFISPFFEEAMPNSKQQLDTVSAQLQFLLENNYDVQLGLRGYTSSLAKGKYNQNLALRRIVSIENQLSTFNKNSLEPFIEDKQLAFVQMPFGEFFSSSVNDDLQDKSRSVYGEMAMRSRKVELVILSITQRDADEKISIPEPYQDLGKIRGDETKDFQFEIINPGKKDIEIESIQAACSCTSVKAESYSVSPEKPLALAVTFSPNGQKGPLLKPIYITTSTGEYVLYFKVYVEESKP